MDGSIFSRYLSFIRKVLSLAPLCLVTLQSCSLTLIAIAAPYLRTFVFRALYQNMPEGTPLVAAELVTLRLTEDHKSTGRLPGLYAALVMPVYASTVAKMLTLQPSVLLEQVGSPLSIFI